MGLGHLRALYPFEELLSTKIVVLGQNPSSSSRSRFLWRNALRGYNWLSRSQQLPVIGKPIFSVLDSLLAIDPIFEATNGKKRSIPLELVEYAVSAGACDDLSKCDGDETVLTSFYTPAIYFSTQKPDVKLLCQICDTDLSRVWVPRKKLSNLYYLAPCSRAYRRLLSYGVAKSNIFLTGFPFPNGLVGGSNQDIALRNFENRLLRFQSVTEKTGVKTTLRVVFAIGGAGAQIDIAFEAAQSLELQIQSEEIEFILLVPYQQKLQKRVIEFKEKFFCKSNFFNVISPSNQTEYFSKFTEIIATADVLWTKPSELSFYSALGIPIIISPPIGAQERANREWLIEIGAGVDQLNPKSAHIWLENLLISGSLYRMARLGWESGIRTGAYKTMEIIEDIL
jgi:hypothetical protein